MIVQDYPEVGAAVIAARLGVTAHAVRQKASRLGVSRSLEAKHRGFSVNRGTVDCYYFDKEWSPDMAWLCGYIHADGHVATSAINLRCAAKDRILVGHARRLLNSKHKIGRYTRVVNGKIKRYVGCNVTNRVLRDGFVNKTGLFGAKSYSQTRLPQDLPEDMVSHYLRGYFDGDGWVSSNDRSFGFVGDHTFLSEILNIGLSWGMSEKKIYPNGNSSVNFCLRWHSTDDLRILHQNLYPEGEKIPLLPRKLKGIRHWLATSPTPNAALP